MRAWRAAWCVALLAAGTGAWAAPVTPHFELDRASGQVTVLAGKLLLVAAPTIKADGQVTPAGEVTGVERGRATGPGLGAGSQQRVTYRGALGTLTLALTEYPGRPYLSAQARFVPSRALALEELRPLDTGEAAGLRLAPGEVRILENGHDLWLDDELRLLPATQASNSNWSHALYRVGPGRAVVAGFLTNRRAITQLRSRPQGEGLAWAAACSYDPAKALQPGEELTSELLYLDAATGEPLAALERFGEAIARANGITPWPARDIPACWDSWNSRYHTQISETNMLENARWVARHLRPYGMRWFQIDDGYQRAVGDWEPNARWAHGMRWFVDQVHGLGLKVGVWIAPFTLHREVPLAREHADWLLDKYAFTPVHEDRVVLDTSLAPVQEWVTQTLHRYSYDWGFDCLNEADYIYQALFGERYRGGMTRAEAYRAGLAAIKRGVKPGTFILGFNPCGLGWGLLDGVRAGDDTGPHWQSGKDTWAWGPKEVAVALARRYYLNHRVYEYDPDAFYFAHADTMKRWGVSEPLSMDTSKAWATLCGLAGGVIKVGDAFVDLSPAETAVVRRVLPPSGVSAQPLDLFTRQYPRLWRLVGRTARPWLVLGVFDWDEPAESGPLALEAGEVGLEPGREYAAYDFWAKRAFTFSLAGGGRLQVSPARRACTLLAIHPVLGRPQYLATDRHVTMGALSLRSESWDPRIRTLRGAMRADPGTAQAVTFLLPEGKRIASRSFTGARVAGESYRPVGPGAGMTGSRGVLYTVRLEVTGSTVRWTLGGGR